MPTADTADLRARLTRALQPHVPPAAVAPMAEAAVNQIGNFAVDDLAGAKSAILQGVLAACPPPYRALIVGLSLVEQAVSAWWAARVVEVEAGSVTVTEHRPD